MCFFTWDELLGLIVTTSRILLRMMCLHNFKNTLKERERDLIFLMNFAEQNFRRKSGMPFVKFPMGRPDPTKI